MRILLATTAGALGLLMTGAAALAPSPAAAQGGSFMASCRNVQTLSNGYVSAECADASGRFRSSTIQYSQCRGDIGNNNGMLTCNGAAASGGTYVQEDRGADRDRNSGYGSNDRNGHGQGYNNGGYNNGGYNNGGYGGGYNNGGYGGGYGSNDRNGYDNGGYNNGGGYNSGGYGDRYGSNDRNGSSGYGDRRPNSVGVSGSYQGSCRSAYVSNGVLAAECADSRGRFRQSSLPYTRCQSDISNQNGMLACTGAMASGGGWVGN